jgi:hypothetical protein
MVRDQGRPSEEEAATPYTPQVVPPLCSPAPHLPQTHHIVHTVFRCRCPILETSKGDTIEGCHPNPHPNSSKLTLNGHLTLVAQVHPRLGLSHL